MQSGAVELQQPSQEEEVKRGRDRDQHKVSLQVNRKSSSGYHTQTRGYNPREHNLSFRGASHGRLQVLQVGKLPDQDPCSFLLPVSFTSACMFRSDMPDITMILHYIKV